MGSSESQREWVILLLSFFSYHNCFSWKASESWLLIYLYAISSCWSRVKPYMKGNKRGVWGPKPSSKWRAGFLKSRTLAPPSLGNPRHFPGWRSTQRLRKGRESAGMWSLPFRGRRPREVERRRVSSEAGWVKERTPTAGWFLGGLLPCTGSYCSAYCLPGPSLKVLTTQSPPGLTRAP